MLLETYKILINYNKILAKDYVNLDKKNCCVNCLLKFIPKINDKKFCLYSPGKYNIFLVEVMVKMNTVHALINVVNSIRLQLFIA